MAVVLGRGWHGWQRTPLTSLMLREGVVAFLSVIGKVKFKHFLISTVLKLRVSGSDCGDRPRISSGC